MYLLTTVKNTHGLLTFDHDYAPGSDLFLDGTDLSGIRFDLRYELARKANPKRICAAHLIHSNGPELVSDKLRSIIEEIAPDSVNFFEPRITCGSEIIKGFSAINVKEKLPCIDLQASEYRQTNFDPAQPTYSFSYLKLLDKLSVEAEIGRCAEQPAYIVVGDMLKAACLREGIGGLMFCRAIDMTYGDRSDCEKS
jgi:hypothetical protein